MAMGKTLNGFHAPARELFTQQEKKMPHPSSPSLFLSSLVSLGPESYFPPLERFHSEAAGVRTELGGI